LHKMQRVRFLSNERVKYKDAYCELDFYNIHKETKALITF
jgi:hypothetical protein